MTVKELRAKLSTVPEDAQVEMVMCQNDNPIEDACRVDKMVYFQWLEKRWSVIGGIVPGVVKYILCNQLNIFFW